MTPKGWSHNCKCFLYFMAALSVLPGRVTADENTTLCTTTLSPVSNGYAVTSTNGDVVVSIITTDASLANYVVTRMHEGTNDPSIGYRVISLHTIESLELLVLQETRYLLQCTNNGLGIFIDHHLWPLIDHLADALQYNLWPMRSSVSVLFPNVLRLIGKLPLTDFGQQSVEISSQSTDVYNLFLDVAKLEGICFKRAPVDEQIYILLGTDTVLSHVPLEASTFISIPVAEYNVSYLNELPDSAYIIVESSITELNINGTIAVSPSHLIAVTSTLMAIEKTVSSLGCVDKDAAICAAHINSIEWSQQMHDTPIAEVMTRLDHDDVAVELVMLRKLPADDTFTIAHYVSYNLVTNEMAFDDGRDIKGSADITMANIFDCRLSNATTSYDETPTHDIDELVELYWRIKPEGWVAAGLTMSILGVLTSISILVFIIVRIFMQDVLEGNPTGSILLLSWLIIMFASFVPFSIEYTGSPLLLETPEAVAITDTLCDVQVFLVTLCYCVSFSLLVCRAVMLASIGSEGGFLSHVNGYIQSVICFFSTLVQVGLSTQLLIVMQTGYREISCQNLLNGNWLWVLLGYDTLLLVFLVGLSPLIARSKRNYQEGVLLIVGSVLCLACWCTWITFSVMENGWREIAVPLGVQGTGWSILCGILIPRSFMIVRGIARSDLAQAIPSLTTLALAQNNQYSSDQSIYECVNPAMRHQTNEDTYSYLDHGANHSLSEIPTLQMQPDMRHQKHAMSYSSSRPSSNKATRF